MTPLIVIFVSVVIILIAVKFAKELAGLAMILVGGLLFGFVVLFFNLNLGAMIIGWCLGLLLFGWILLAVAGLVSGIVLGPLALIAGGIRLFFDKLFK